MVTTFDAGLQFVHLIFTDLGCFSDRLLQLENVPGLSGKIDAFLGNRHRTLGRFLRVGRAVSPRA